MDLARGFWHSVIANYGVSSCSSILNSKLRSGARDCSLAGDTRVFCRLRSKRKRLEVAASQCSAQCSVCVTHFAHLKERRQLLVGACRPRKLWRETVWLQCQRNDSVAYVNGDSQDLDVTESPTRSMHDSSAEGSEIESCSVIKTNDSVDNNKVEYELEELRELLLKAMTELEVARINSAMFEQKAQSISESAIAIKDEAENAWRDVTSAVTNIQKIVNEETAAKEAVQKATMALSMAEARLWLAIGVLDPADEVIVLPKPSFETDVEQGLLSAQVEIKDCKAYLENCGVELKRIHNKKEELQKEADRLSEIAEKAQLNALKAEEEVTNIMLLAEQAVAFELEVTQQVNDADLALQKAERAALSADFIEQQGPPSHEQPNEEVYPDKEQTSSGVVDGSDAVRDSGVTPHDVAWQSVGDTQSSPDLPDWDVMLNPYPDKEAEVEAKSSFQVKKQEVQAKDLTKDSPVNAPKGLLKKSSRFFSASFFSFYVEGKEFTPASIFLELVAFVKKQASSLVLATLLFGLGAALVSNRAEKNYQLLQQPDIITSIEEVTSTAKPIVREIRRFPKRLKKIIALLSQLKINEEEASLFDMLWLLLASVIFVPIFQKIPGAMCYSSGEVVVLR